MTEKKNVLEITDEDAGNVSGGTEAECREIYELNITHDPELFAKAKQFTDLTDADPLYGTQVMIEKALEFQIVLVAPTVQPNLPNLYVKVDGGKRYTQAEVMQLLREKYGE